MHMRETRKETIATCFPNSEANPHEGQTFYIGGCNICLNQRRKKRQCENVGIRPPSLGPMSFAHRFPEGIDSLTIQTIGFFIFFSHLGLVSSMCFMGQRGADFLPETLPPLSTQDFELRSRFHRAATEKSSWGRSWASVSGGGAPRHPALAVLHVWRGAAPLWLIPCWVGLGELTTPFKF